jgi:hypothetical protein
MVKTSAFVAFWTRFGKHLMPHKVKKLSILSIKREERVADCEGAGAQGSTFAGCPWFAFLVENLSVYLLICRTEALLSFLPGGSKRARRGLFICSLPLSSSFSASSFFCCHVGAVPLHVWLSPLSRLLVTQTLACIPGMEESLPSLVELAVFCVGMGG